ncbi:MAG: response regulator transcription factor [Burkholderiales bacterium]
MTGTQTILVADDDAAFRDVLARALRRRGYDVLAASSCEEAMALAQTCKIGAAVVDLRMPAESGLALIPRLKEHEPSMRILMLTGFASITTAVEAIKLGATNYLAKPADASEILAALFSEAVRPDMAIPEQPLSVERLEWEHIQKVLADHAGNISATARALSMHRRTLQRKLGKKPVAQ